MKENSATFRRSAHDVLKHHFGKAPKQLRAINGGLVNHVFEARVGRESVIVRISNAPEKLQVFMKEQWAVAAARKQGVPTPEILEVSNELIGLPYMISRRMAGQAGGQLVCSRREILRELGHYAARINSVRTHDFGHIFDWSPNKLSRNRTWQQYLQNELQVEQRLNILRKLLQPANFRKLFAQVRELEHWSGEPNLNHGDLRLKNLILDDRQKIVGIVDWEDCMSQMAPCWELSIALHDLTTEEKHSFLEGYGLRSSEYERIAPGVKALNLLNYAPTVGHAMERKETARLRRLAVRLNGAFDLYSL